MEPKLQHLALIQGIINRLSQNSFLLKGWSVVIIAGLLALATKGDETSFVYLAYLPSMAFWWLDGYFLRQENLYRKLYDDVRGRADADVDFSMNTSTYTAAVGPSIKICFSITLAVFHGALFLVITAIALYPFLQCPTGG